VTVDEPTDGELAAIVAAILAPIVDPDHPDHVHKCRSLYGDEECPESPCICRCGAVQLFEPFNDTGGVTPICWGLPDGRRFQFPDPREREDALADQRP
jgi:hypothetical protein